MKTEIIVYTLPMLLEYDRLGMDEVSDEEFIAIVKEDGRIYDLSDFQKAFNSEEVAPEIDYIRFIETPKEV